jgi:cation diffusion facilitator family transporter
MTIDIESTKETQASAGKEKKQAALSSVVAAVFLTGLKVVVGLLTGSLGILAEAAHSALDFIAALITYIAVKVTDKPADKEHPYGHGKIENLSAMFETLLLLVTCIWIIHEAVERIFFRHVHVDASIWAFIVMIISIVIDVSRSKMLYSAARKHKSQALEADALHFSTDVWSSSVVILGLICVKIADFFPSLSVLKGADAIAALGVALIVIYVSIRLGLRTIQALLDAAPKGMAEKIKKAVEAIPNILDCHNIRLRASGPRLFVDVHVLMEATLTLKEVHDATEIIEQAIQKIADGADITVHPEPKVDKTEKPNP